MVARVLRPRLGVPPAALAIVRTALRHVAAQSDLFAPGRGLVVGFSGGQDSACLLHALAEMSRNKRFRLWAAHVDHALRADSAADAARAVEMARSLGVDALVRRVDVAAYRAGLHRWSVQQAGRAARYQALASMVSQVGGDALLVAHTADDQSETVLLNLLRGAGLAGLAAMRVDEAINPSDLGPPLEELAAWGAALPARLRLVRPLLRVERSTTRAYCMDVGLPFAEDPSNQSRAFTRNRIRLELLPALEQFNPAVRTVLARTADLAADDLEALERLARSVHAKLARPEGEALRYDPAAWHAQPRAVQRRLLRLGIETLAGSLRDVPAAPIEDALDFLLHGGASGRVYNLPHGVEVCTSGGSFLLRRRLYAP
jgi:tRNA(Ile)-lysidine synthetase-like protein